MHLFAQWIRLACRLFVASFLLLITARVANSCEFLPGWSTMSINIPLSGSYAIPRDAAVGTVIVGFSLPSPSGNFATCAEPSGQGWRLTVQPQPVVGEGIYQTGVPGIGVRILNGIGTAMPTGQSLPAGPVSFIGTEPVYQLVVIGPVGAGVISAAQLPSVRYRLNRSLVIYHATTSGSVNILQKTCQTPSVTVPLGTRSRNDFTAVGQPMKPSAVNFTIPVNACPAGMSGIQYRIDPTTTILDGNKGLVALDSTSTATGVAIKLMTGAGRAQAFSTWQTLTRYNPPTGGSYSIPLQATYVQTSTTLRSGTASTSLTFSMQYN